MRSLLVQIFVNRNPTVIIYYLEEVPFSVKPFEVIRCQGLLFLSSLNRNANSIKSLT